MPNPFYNMMMGGGNPFGGQPAGGFSGIQFQNPMQKAQYIMQAMQNPAAFVRQAMPDIPAEIANDPNRILQYMQQTRGITNEQIQQAANQIPRY